MKHASRMPPRHEPFAHLHAELAAHRGGWKVPLLALAGVALVVTLGITFIPVPDTARDFRQEPVSPPAAHAGPAFEPLAWADLVPAGWDASAELRRLQAAQAGVSDDDPAARASFKTMRRVLDNAPGDPALAGRKVRIPGYVVPLDRQSEGLSEFLLVPYFGACIHTPPPPANQIIHVVAARPMKGLRSMAAIWVTGTLSVARHDTDVAVSGYRLQAVSTEPYEPVKTP